MAAPQQTEPTEGLEKYLQKPGSYFIAVEAGADTKPLENLQKKAESDGYTILRAPASKADRYVFERIWPDKLQHYAKDIPIPSPAKLQRAFIIAPSGLLPGKIDAEESKLDDDVYASMLTAVTHFLEDSISGASAKDSAVASEPYQVIHRGNFTCELVYNQNFSTAVIYEGDLDPRMKSDLQKTHQKIDEQFGTVLKTWDGNPISGDLDGILRENLFDAQKYTGKYDADTLKYLHVQRKEKTLHALEDAARKDKILVYVDNLENLDSATAESMEHVARNAKAGNFVFIGTYAADSLREEPEIISNVRKGLTDEADYETLKAPADIEEILNTKFKGLNKFAYQFLAIAAAADYASDKTVLRKAAESLGIKTEDIMESTSQLAAAQLLKDWKPANSKIAKKALENATPEFYKTIAETIEASYSYDIQRFSPLLADLYEKAELEGKVIEWAKKSAEHFTNMSDFESAIKSYQRIFELLKDKTAQLETLEKKLDVEGAHGNLNLLEEDGEKLYNLAKELGDKRLHTKALLAWGRALQGKYRNDSGLKQLDEAITLLTDLNQKDGLAEAHYYRVGCFMNAGKNSDALNEIEQTEKLAREAGNEKMLGNALNTRGLLCQREKNYAGAEKTFLAARKTFEGIKDFADAGKILNNLANLYLDTRDFKKAIEAGEEGCRELSKANYLLPIPPLLQTLGAAYEALGDSAKAKETFARADEYALRIGNTKIAAFAKYSQGLHSGKQEREKCFNEAADVLRKHPLKSNELAPLLKSIEEEVAEDVSRWKMLAKKLGHEEKINSLIEDLLKKKK